MQFSNYINDLGIQKTASTYNVSSVTARSWSRMDSAPSPFKAFEIVKRTEGLVSWADIYEPFINHNSKEQALTHGSTKTG